MSFRAAVAGGGTAGHIEPALAVADALRSGYDATVIALGTPRGLEKDLVPPRGYELHMINPVPFPRKINADLFKLPIRVYKAIKQARKILKTNKIDILIGFGGYVSAPAYIAARSLGIPFFVHEANARAGMANKLGVLLGGEGLNAVADSGIKGQVVGVPIRNTFREYTARKEESCALWNLDPHKPIIVVTGGSQGARSINEAIERNVEKLLDQGIQVLHAYGKKNKRPDIKGAEERGYRPVEYIDNMPAALRIADIMVCRSGAMTVAEVSHAHVPALYIPLAIGNGEQALNAQPIVDRGGARMIQDQQLKDNSVDLAQEITAMLEPDTHQKMLYSLKESTQIPAADRIADLIAQRLKITQPLKNNDSYNSASDKK